MDRRDRNYVEKGILTEIKGNPSLQETLEGEVIYLTTVHRTSLVTVRFEGGQTPCDIISTF